VGSTCMCGCCALSCVPSCVCTCVIACADVCFEAFFVRDIVSSMAIAVIVLFHASHHFFPPFFACLDAITQSSSFINIFTSMVRIHSLRSCVCPACSAVYFAPCLGILYHSAFAYISINVRNRIAPRTAAKFSQKLRLQARVSMTE
jgi:hypothetical protein